MNKISRLLPISKFTPLLAISYFLLTSNLAYAWHIPADNLDSLVYASQDIVVARVHVQKTPLPRNVGCENAVKEHEKNPDTPFPPCAMGPNTTSSYTATVLEPLAGTMQQGSVFEPNMNTLGFYPEPEDGQTFIYFLGKSDPHFQLSNQRPTRWILVDENKRVRLNYADVVIEDNDKPFSMEGPAFYANAPEFTPASGRHVSAINVTFSPEGYGDDGTGNVVPLPPQSWDAGNLPSLEQMKKAIVDSIAHTASQRPLLEKQDTPASDIPALLAIAHEHESPVPAWNDDIFFSILSKIMGRGDTATVLDLFSTMPPYWQDEFFESRTIFDTSLIPTGSFHKTAELKPFITDASQPLPRRIAAVRLAEKLFPINFVDSAKLMQRDGQINLYTEFQDACTQLLFAANTDDALRVACLPFMDVKKPESVTALTKFYHDSHSAEAQYAIELAFADRDDINYDLAMHERYMKAPPPTMFPYPHNFPKITPLPPESPLYASLQPADSPVISIVRNDVYPAQKAGRLAVRAEWQRLRSVWDKPLSYGYVLVRENDNKHYDVLRKPDSQKAYKVDRDELAMPSVPPGKYLLLLEFSQDGKVISSGHGLDLSLPLASNASQQQP